jgi:hypothetical protein
MNPASGSGRVLPDPLRPVAPDRAVVPAGPGGPARAPSYLPSFAWERGSRMSSMTPYAFASPADMK